MKPSLSREETVRVVSLGCSKNLVDSEYLLKQIQAGGFQTLHNEGPEGCHAVIINTCGFILDARNESIRTILEYLREKEIGRIKKVFVIGCLTERYKSSLKAELPEVDGVFGLNETRKILRALGTSYRDELVGERVLTTPGHYAYLKVSEGCNRKCAFCAIPLIRGRQKSVPVENILKEAEYLAGKGVKELLLIAQDLTSYGTDLYRKRALPELLDKLCEVDGIEWIRLHYTYPAAFPVEEIISLMKKHRKICRYLDMPLQHTNKGILRAMKRGHDKEDAKRIIGRFRKEFPGMAIRTTLITGFPGEGRSEFLELKSFVREMQFDRLGVFTYSHEDQTPACKTMNDTIPEKTKKRRMETLLKIQEEISMQKNREKIGSIYRVLIDGREGKYYLGRTEYDSPEVDNEVLIPLAGKKLHTGRFYPVRITGAGDYELFGEVIGQGPSTSGTQ